MHLSELIPQTFLQLHLSHQSNAPDENHQCRKFKITHQFHPLYGCKFNLFTYRHNWGKFRVYFYDKEDNLISIPATWTDIEPEDPFVEASQGQSLFRIEDLIQLVDVIENVNESLNKL